MLYKTAELEGDLLDAAVVVALGLKGNLTDGRAGCYMISFDTGPSESEDGDVFKPSTLWGHGGPIFERHYEQITAQLLWWCGHDWERKIQLSRLVWFMRGFVGSIKGDEVEL